MLVLTRKTGEEILIGAGIRLVVNRISGNRVTLGIAAPQEMPIARGELRSGPPSTAAPQADETIPADTLLTVR